jgi:chromosomal replication initiation ATPase DnaA
MEMLKARGLAVVWVDDLPYRALRAREKHPLPAEVFKIIQGVAHSFGLTREDLLREDNRRHIVRARHIAIYLLRLVRLPYLTIGTLLEQRHSTAINAVRCVRERMGKDPALAAKVERLANELIPGWRL